MKNCDAYHICLIGELLDFIQKSTARNNKNITYGDLVINSRATRVLMTLFTLILRK